MRFRSLEHDIYRGKVQSVNGSDRFYRLTGKYKEWTPQSKCPYLYKLQWYDEELEKIERLLKEEDLRVANELLSRSEIVGDAHTKKRARTEPSAKRRIYHAVTGSGGQGLTQLSKYFLYHFCGRLPLSDRPDVLYVQQSDWSTELIISLLYHQPNAGQGRSACCSLLVSSLCNTPGWFWELHGRNRPLYIVVDAVSPVMVQYTLNFLVPEFLADCTLMVYFASSASRRQAMKTVPKDQIWPFPYNAPVEGVSKDDYLAFGYVCAQLPTRAFLRSVAQCPASPDVDALDQRTLDTPPRVLQVMEYMYSILGGSARYLVHLVTVLDDPFAHYNVVVNALREATSASPLAKLSWVDDSGAVRTADMDRVRQMCARRISACLGERADVSQLEVAGALLFRQVPVEQKYKFAGPMSRYVEASAALRCVFYHLLKARCAPLIDAIELLTGWTGRRYFSEHMNLTVP